MSSHHPGADGSVWYVAYGANMHTERLRCYVEGGSPSGGSPSAGSPAGGARTYPGCRDRRMPTRSVAVELPGTVYFATESPVWTGGRAFYDPAGTGRAAGTGRTATDGMWGRAHLLTAEQFADIAAQEMYEPPGRDLDLTGVLAAGRARLGPGRYETLVNPGELDGLPLLTFTAPWTAAEVEWTRPSAPYLRHLANGLLETGRWEREAVAAYLVARPGAVGRWTPDEVIALLAADARKD